MKDTKKIWVRLDRNVALCRKLASNFMQEKVSMHKKPYFFQAFTHEPSLVEGREEERPKRQRPGSWWTHQNKNLSDELKEGISTRHSV